MTIGENDSWEYTDKAWDVLYDVVDSIEFINHDAELIFEAISKRIKLIPFGEYLKRYIYRKAELKDPFKTIPLKTYQSDCRKSYLFFCKGNR